MSDQAPSTTSSDSLAAGKSHALQAAEELRDAASLKAAELKDATRERADNIKNFATGKADEAREYAEHRYEEARTMTQDYRDEGERYVRENPAKSVLIALGLGFIIGRILR